MCSFANLIGTTSKHQISLIKWAYDLYEIALGRTFFDIDPFRGAVLHSDDEHSLACAHNTCTGDEQDGLPHVDGPLHGGIHSGSKPAIRIVHIQFHWHRARSRVNGPRDSSDRAGE